MLRVPLAALVLNRQLDRPTQLPIHECSAARVQEQGRWFRCVGNLRGETSRGCSVSALSITTASASFTRRAKLCSCFESCLSLQRTLLRTESRNRHQSVHPRFAAIVCGYRPHVPPGLLAAGISRSDRCCYEARHRANPQGAPRVHIRASEILPERAISKLPVRNDGAQIKIEVTPVLRGCV